PSSIVPWIGTTTISPAAGVPADAPRAPTAPQAPAISATSATKRRKVTPRTTAVRPPRLRGQLLADQPAHGVAVGDPAHPRHDGLHHRALVPAVLRQRGDRVAHDPAQLVLRKLRRQILLQDLALAALLLHELGPARGAELLDGVRTLLDQLLDDGGLVVVGKVAARLDAPVVERRHDAA